MEDLFGHDSAFGLRKKEWSYISPAESDELVEKVFRELRQNGFPHFRLSRHERHKIVKQLYAFKPKAILLGENTIGQNMTGQNLLNHHMPHIWSVRSHGFLSPIETFSDDSKLRTAIRKRLKLGDNISLCGIRKSLSWSNGTQKASSFRPTAAKAIYWKLKGQKVLDFSAGFGGRLLGAMSLRNVQYVGVDPSTDSINGLREMISEYGWKDNAKIIHGAFEDIDPGDGFDLAFSSPPYFNTEEYSDDDGQSYRRYSTRASWRNGFLRPTIQKCFDALKPGATFAINIANVSTYQNLEAHTVEDALNVGFIQGETLSIQFSKLMGNGFKHEPIFTFTKP